MSLPLSLLYATHFCSLPFQKSCLMIELAFHFLPFSVASTAVGEKGHRQKQNVIDRAICSSILALLDAQVEILC